ncbi:spermidine synthase [Nannocystis pusilla]|uniref:spermidine synthase n=1 Tax=Nannocystis pusilla TaxID=889268 RepID=UPI003DA54506
MLAGLALARPLRDVLMIGLGAGVIPRFLRAYLPEVTVEVVEIDPLVIDVARRFFAVEADERLRIHEGDGRKFVADGVRPQDAVILDGHGLGGVPRHLSTCEFLASVRAALAPSGVVVANVWSAAANRYYDATLATYREVFERVHVLDVVGLGNKIIVASAEPAALTREEVIARAHALSVEQRLPIDLGLHVHKVQAVDDLRVRASALRDPSFSW